MVYKTTSIDEVIGRIIRNTRVQDASYIADMVEWIPEAMGYMRTKVELVPEWEDVGIHFHLGKLPCGLQHITAVEWQGCRVPELTSARKLSVSNLDPTTDAALDTNTGFVTVPTTTNAATPGQVYNYLLQGLTTCTATECNSLTSHVNAWYQVEMDYLQFSVPNTLVRVHYMSIPLDESGLPRIPDQEDYKQALYYYTRMMMQGAGFEDKMYTILQLQQLFEQHAARAMGKIRYPSVDSMEMKVQRMTRLVVDPNYFKSFFAGTGPEKYYGNTNVNRMPNV